jgi:hypothetical protein
MKLSLQKSALALVAIAERYEYLGCQEPDPWLAMPIIRMYLKCRRKAREFLREADQCS